MYYDAVPYDAVRCRTYVYMISLRIIITLALPVTGEQRCGQLGGGNDKRRTTTDVDSGMEILPVGRWFDVWHVWVLVNPQIDYGK